MFRKPFVYFLRLRKLFQERLPHIRLHIVKHADSFLTMCFKCHKNPLFIRFKDSFHSKKNQTPQGVRSFFNMSRAKRFRPFSANLCRIF